MHYFIILVVYVNQVLSYVAVYTDYVFYVLCSGMSAMTMVMDSNWELKEQVLLQTWL